MSEDRIPRRELVEFLVLIATALALLAIAVTIGQPATNLALVVDSAGVALWDLVRPVRSTTEPSRWLGAVAIAVNGGIAIWSVAKLTDHPEGESDILWITVSVALVSTLLWLAQYRRESKPEGDSS